MNIRKAIIWFGIWGAVILIIKWFYSEAYQFFAPFLLVIPLGVLLIWSIVFGAWAVIIVFQKLKKEHIKSVIPLIIFLIVTSLYFFTSFEIPKVKLEYLLYIDKRQEMIVAIQNGELTDDGIGNVKLPSKYRHLSCNGEAYIFENDEPGTVIGFWAFRGLLMNSYSSVIYTTYDAPPTCLILHCAEIYTIEKLDEHWFYVIAY